MSMDKEDGFERGFVAGWKARGEHEDALLIEAELAERQAKDGLDELEELSLRLLRQQQNASQTGQQEVNQQSWPRLNQ